ncbi:MAG: putative GFO/IDH/MocA family oxidoreductase [Verrucomicrobiales bacterium]|nr:putative GFO/IDH/MocA family oxidoreductase [Verrucomicrobiales bacterium]RYD36250.1 MAG: Gfo/Idh/MocA family oxidoreductase [Verrucomicrobiaceae bacterium]
MKTVRVGIIGGGLMGREVASAFARWVALTDISVTPVLHAVADVSPPVLEWFRRVPGVALLTTDYHEMLADPQVDVVYVAVPHHLHEAIYLDVLKAGKDLLAEKPFGIDLDAARRIGQAGTDTGRFVRCSSEFPFFPGPQKVIAGVKSGAFGRLLEIRSGFHHSSDLDPTKPANWKRSSRSCGEIGVMGDLGMHTLHVPLRLGWKPARLYAQLQKGVPERPGPDGKPVPCDTWDNAMLHTWIDTDGNAVPLRLEMKRLAPGATNSWFLEVLGTEGGMRYSTAEPKTLHTFRRNGGSQVWERTDLGFGMPFATVTGGIFEPGFPDIMQQMWAAYLAERDGTLGDRFGCVRPEEAIASHEVFAAALRSHAGQTVESV